MSETGSGVDKSDPIGPNRPTNLEQLRQTLSEGGIHGFPIGPPLPGDSEWFLGRESEINRVFELLNEGKSVFVGGPFRAGKSSLIERVIFLAKERMPTVYFSNSYDSIRLKVADDLDKTLKKFFDRKPIPSGTQRIVFCLDEAGSENYMPTLADLPERLRRTSGVQDVQFLLAGVGDLSDMKKRLNRKKLVARLKMDRKLPQEIDTLLSWFPKDEIILEPAIPVDIAKLRGIDWTPPS